MTAASTTKDRAYALAREGGFLTLDQLVQALDAEMLPGVADTLAVTQTRVELRQLMADARKAGRLSGRGG